LVAAVKCYKLAADQNCIDAQVSYAVCLSNGRGVRVDSAAAARYFKLAADQGHVVTSPLELTGMVVFLRNVPFSASQKSAGFSMSYR
jgi:TPR repeat protein